MVVPRFFLIKVILFLSFTYNQILYSFQVTPVLGLANASYQPLASEKTPNYFGPEIGLLLGYHAFNYWENALFFSFFFAAHPDKKKPKINMSTVGFYTGLAEHRFYRLGILAGYSLVNRIGLSLPTDPAGSLQGSSYGFSIGTLHKARGKRNWQISFDYLQSTLVLGGISTSSSNSTRKLDKFQIRLGYTYN